MASRIGRAEILPLIIALGFLTARWISEGEFSHAMFRDVGYAIFGLFLIWFRQPLGRFVGWSRCRYISRPTPPIIVAAAGWFFMLGMPIIMMLIDRSAD